jgi:hypothetical protein
MVMDPAASNLPATPALPHGSLTGRQEKAAQLYVAGDTQTGAYIKAYKKQHYLPKTAKEAASRLFNLPKMKDRIAQLTAKSEIKTVLSLNDRLAICAKHAQSTAVKPDTNLRAVDLYTKIAGGFAPEVHELTGPGGAPVQVEQTVIHVSQIPLRQRYAAMVAARKARDAQ